MRARALPVGSATAPAARREPGALPHVPPLPAACLAAPPQLTPGEASREQWDPDRAARWSVAARPCELRRSRGEARGLPPPLRAEPLAFWPCSPPKKREPPPWLAPQPVAATGGALEKIYGVALTTLEEAEMTPGKHPNSRIKPLPLC
jgi:hypothetical protein